MVLVRAIAIAATLIAAALAGRAHAGISVIPLPEILTDPNEGNTYGFLPVILLLDRNGRLEHIIADDVRYNRITGWFPAFRLFGYPFVDQRYYVTLRKSEKIDEDYIAEYERRNMFGGSTDVLANGTFFRDSRMRFFGFGNNAGKEQETNYTQQKAAVSMRLAYRPVENLEVAWRGRFEDVSIRRGGVPRIPFTGARFPMTQGLHGSTVNAQGVSFAYDDRDSPTITTQGTLGAAYVEVIDQALGSSHSYTKYGFEFRRFTPLRERFVLAFHGVLDYLDGASRAPFYERNSIGGVKSLRGFGNDRFVDSNRFFSTVELRTLALRRQMFDVLTEFEVAPFVDAGQVFPSPTDLPFDDLHLVGGVGFRGIVRPQVVGFVDIGYGSDGAAVFTGLDYPF